MGGTSFQVKVKVVGAEKVQRQLKKIRKEIRNQKDLQAKFAEEQRQQIISNVRGGRGPEGRLKPLKPATLRKRQTEGRVGGSRPLIETGRMIRSIQHRTRRSGKMTETVIAPNQIELKKASIHQSGSRSRKIPARPFLGFTQKDESRLKRGYETHVKNAIKTR